MQAQRKDRIAASLRGTITEILRTEMNDPRLGFVTVTGVDVSPDLRQARVHVSVLGDAANQEETVAALQGAVKFVRRRVSRILNLKRTPSLSFSLDTTIERADRIDRLLAEAGLAESTEHDDADED